MVTFSHLDTGTTEADWADSGRLSRLSPLSMPLTDRLVVLAAHPDDETLGAAGLTARLAHAGLPTIIVVATDGEASHPNSPTHTSIDLGVLRRSESSAALEVIAPRAQVEFLGIPDGQIQENITRLRRHVTKIIARLSGRALILAPWHGDGHRDHRVLGELARAVSDSTGSILLEYPIWMWHWANPHSDTVPWNSLRRINLTPEEHSLKIRAIQKHHSQLQPLSATPGDEALLNPTMQSHFTRNFEVFMNTAEGHTGEPS